MTGSSGGRGHGPGAWTVPGQAPERTYQAWTRSALSLVVCALLATRLAGDVGPAALVVPVLATVAAVAVVLRQKKHLRSGRDRYEPYQLLFLTITVVALALACAVLVLLPT